MVYVSRVTPVIIDAGLVIPTLVQPKYHLVGFSFHSVCRRFMPYGLAVGKSD